MLSRRVTLALLIHSSSAFGARKSVRKTLDPLTTVRPYQLSASASRFSSQLLLTLLNVGDAIRGVYRYTHAQYRKRCTSDLIKQSVGGTPHDSKALQLVTTRSFAVTRARGADRRAVEPYR